MDLSVSVVWQPAGGTTPEKNKLSEFLSMIIPLPLPELGHQSGVLVPTSVLGFY